MLDVSRDRIPTMGHLRSLVELLALLKFNHLQLYFEHTFAYRGYEQIWHGLDAITPRASQRTGSALRELRHRARCESELLRTPFSLAQAS